MANICPDLTLRCVTWAQPLVRTGGHVQYGPGRGHAPQRAQTSPRAFEESGTLGTVHDRVPVISESPRDAHERLRPSLHRRPTRVSGSGNASGRRNGRCEICHWITPPQTLLPDPCDWCKLCGWVRPGLQLSLTPPKAPTGIGHESLGTPNQPP